MVSIKNVVLAGANGSVGQPALQALVDSGKFNVTVFKRASSKSSFPSSVKVVDVDWDSVESLTAALKGQDAVVSTLNLPHAAGAQENLVQAAVAAKVYRFLPSEFGSDLAVAKTAALPVFGAKVAINNKLAEAAASSGLTYTLIRNSGFLDWGLNHGFLFDASKGTPLIFNGGDRPFSATNLATVATAIVGVLSHPEETANRAVYIKDIDVTQNQLLEIAKRIWPEKSWAPVPITSAELAAKSDQDLQTGNIGPTTFVNYLFRAIFEEGYGGQFSKTDNELLGVKGISLAELEAQWRAAARS